MRSEWTPLAPTFRSQLQGRLLALTLLAPEREWSVTELAAALDAPLTSVQNEVARLVEGRILTDRRVGRNRLVTANAGNPAVRPLTDLTLISFGPPLVIAEEFAGLNADAIVIFGSWAARYVGETGATPRDVDVLVLAQSIDRHALFQAARSASRRLGLDVNPVSRTLAQWRHPGRDPLLGDIVAKPHVLVAGELP